MNKLMVQDAFVNKKNPLLEGCELARVTSQQGAELGEQRMGLREPCVGTTQLVVPALKGN